MEIRPIRSDSEHDAVLREIENLWLAAPGTPEGDRLEILTLLAEAWEEQHHPIALPDPIEAIKFRLEQLGMDHRALIGVIGSRSRVSEVLNRKRPLSLEMIRKLHARFGIPAHVLIQGPAKPMAG